MYYGREYLKNKLVGRIQPYVESKYRLYEMENVVNDFTFKNEPLELRQIRSVFGWCAKAVNTIADRLSVRGFKVDNFGMSELFNVNNSDILYDSAILSSLISACSFIYIGRDEEGNVSMQVIDGRNATGIIDPITYMLKEGYAVLQRNEDGDIMQDAYFTAEETIITTSENRGVREYSYKNPAPYPLLVPIINRPDSKKDFGHSRITKDMVSAQTEAIKTMHRMNVSSIFYSYPQRYVLGVDPDTEDIDKWKAAMAAILLLGDDEDGNRPSVGQFPQQSMAPYLEELKTIASLFAGASGLTMDDLGFVLSNPTSDDAIRSSHENLRLYAEKCQKHFSIGFTNAGYIARCVQDNRAYKRNEIYGTELLWKPVFNTDASMLGTIGDAVFKINQAIPGFIDEAKLKEITGF